MIVRSMVVLAAMLGSVTAARAEAIATARLLFAEVWQSSDCNQQIDTALNNSRYYELGGGYSLGIVLCRLEQHAQSDVLFMVAPKTGGKPQLLSFQAWYKDRFDTTQVLWGVRYEPDKKMLMTFMPYQPRRMCGTVGEWVWNGQAFEMTGYWVNPDCREDSEFDLDRHRIFPPK